MLKEKNWYIVKILSTCMLIKLIGFTFAYYIFFKYTQVLDYKLYIEGFYNSDTSLRTRLIGIISSSIYNMFGLLAVNFIFGCISIIGVAYFYLRGGKSILPILFLLLPSSLIWTSIIGKEAIFFGFYCLLIVIWCRYVTTKLDYSDYLLFLVSLVICIVLRPHYSIVIIWLYLSTFLVKHRFLSYKSLIFLYVCIVSLIYIYLYGSLVDRGFFGIDYDARSSRFKVFNLPQTEEGVLLYHNFLPLSFFMGIIGPLISELRVRIEFLPFFIEGIFILISPLFFIILNLNRKVNIYNIDDGFVTLIYFLALVLAMFLHAPFGILNPGSAIRWRVNFEPLFYLLPVFLINLNEKNFTYPSR